MKKLLTAVFCAVAIFGAIDAKAQLAVGAGWLNDTERLVINDDKGKETNRGMARRNGFYAGAQFNIPIFAGLSVVPGLYATMQFSRSTETANVWGGAIAGAETTKYRELALNVPINAQYAIEAGNVKVLVFLGPVLQYGLVSKTTSTGTFGVLGYTTTATAITDNYTGRSTFDDGSTLDGDPVRKPFNVYLGGGLGVELNESLQFTIGYDHSLTNIAVEKNNILSRSQLKVGVAYLF